jgi:nucleoside-diphosphate-sugar epimerase
LLKIIYTTGLTGFIGQYFLKKIFNDYDVVINFGRKKNITVHQHSFEPIFKEFNLSELKEYPSDTLVHLATYYNPNPINIAEEAQLEESNFNFPYSLCNILKNYGLKRIISASSYLQLSDIQHKSLYSKTKCKFINWAKSEFELTEVFLFDTFGNNDQRSKVLDTFIKNSILNYDIQIPLKRVDINLTHVEEVADSLINALGLKAGQYMIMSDNQLTIKELAQRVVSIEKTSTKINATLDGNNLIRRINSFPENIYLNSLKQDFTEQIKTRYDEIRQANSF